jgi:endonuclease YncB( thermonuclease family)/bifunctional DNA-binding transcriptional regulator/antitoxin component of YhaV-PrlF toxin-antitoxin module
MGTLKVIGKIELKQFWPEGLSDADTSSVMISVNQDSFFYQKDNSAPFRKTKAFYDSYVVGKAKSKLVKNNKIKVRFQGIDAPELHYRAPVIIGSDITAEIRKQYNAKNKEFRQNLSESATVALSRFLRSIDKTVVECEVISYNVEHPREVVDTYGRFVANLIVRKKNKKYDLNLWLAKEGWVVPTFYSSMSPGEMDDVLTAVKAGKKKKNRIWKKLNGDTSKFKYSQQIRKDVTGFKIGDDAGQLIMPKLFRRQAGYELQKKVKIFEGTFATYLTKSKDPFYKLNEFLNEGFEAKLFYLDEFFNTKKFTLSPEHMVFREKYSNVVDSKGNDVASW